MNWLILLAGILASFTTIGHFTKGRKEYLIPMLKSDLPLVPKKVMHSVFHYISVYLILSSLALLAVGAGIDFCTQADLLISFIAVNYALFAVWQIIIAVTSGIPKSLTNLFQWVFFLLIAVLAWLGL